ncbi:MAG: hypothetical protein IKV37_04380, partial [Prevotella sp.]|nr:hypothetical protein [Prevotella sp.]
MLDSDDSFYGVEYKHIIFTVGLWIKKRQYIPNFSSEISANGTDLRSVGNFYYQTGCNQGRPNDDVIDQYFFLPAIAWTYYWTKSPAQSSYAYALEIDHY